MATDTTIPMEFITDYLTMRETYLQAYMYKLQKCKKLHPETWTEKDELELLKLSIHRKEVSKINQITKTGRKHKEFAYYYNKQKIKYLKMKSQSPAKDNKEHTTLASLT